MKPTVNLSPLAELVPDPQPGTLALIRAHRPTAAIRVKNRKRLLKLMGFPFRSHYASIVQGLIPQVQQATSAFGLKNDSIRYRPRTPSTRYLMLSSSIPVCTYDFPSSMTVLPALSFR